MLPYEPHKINSGITYGYISPVYYALKLHLVGINKYVIHTQIVVDKGWLEDEVFVIVQVALPESDKPCVDVLR